MYTKEIALQSKNPDFRYTFFGGCFSQTHTNVYTHSQLQDTYQHSLNDNFCSQTSDNQMFFHFWDFPPDCYDSTKLLSQLPNDTRMQVTHSYEEPVSFAREC